MMRKYHKYLDTQIVHLDFPDEITLAINLTNCPCHCKGCHSPELWGDTGWELTDDVLSTLIEQELDKITCVGLMGGDSNVNEVVELAKFIRTKYPKLKIGWYSGRTVFPLEAGVFNYIKLGPWVADLGPLTSPNTNQAYYINLNPERSDYMHPAFADITEKAFRAPKPWDPDYFDYEEKMREKEQKNDVMFINKS